MTAKVYSLDNLVAIVDHNRLQAQGTIEDRFNLTPIAEKWQAFGWNVIDIDGHNMEEILSGLDEADKVKGKPSVIIARTVKGKGLSFAENVVGFHNGMLTEETYAKALAELGA
jgi:transketolase